MTASAHPSGTRRQHQADETRARLVEIAWEMVRTDGVGEFTVRKLAQRAGVSVGLPHAHFGTREDLVDELRIRAWDRIDEVIGAAVGPAALDVLASADRAEYPRALRRGLEAVVAFALREPHVYDLVALTPGMHLSDRVLARELETAQRFILMLANGAQAGAFRFEGDPSVYALALWTGVQGYVHRVRGVTAPGFHAFQEKVFDVLLRVFLDAICVGGAEGSER